MKVTALLKGYQKAAKIAVISSYPPKGTLYGDNVVGIASFTKNFIIPLVSQSKVKAIVLAEIIDRPDIYEERGILVIRCWKRQSWGILPEINRQLEQFKSISSVEIQLEFNNFGNIWVTACLPLFSLYHRLKGKRTILVLHQVITDLCELSGHLGLDPKSFKNLFFSIAIRLYYYLSCFINNNVIVLEQTLADRLHRLGVPYDKIKTIEHGVDKNVPSINKYQAAKTLGLQNKKIFLVFGFITWYKGTDLIIKAFKNLLRENPELKSQVQLVIAGGPNPHHLHEKHYQQFIRNISREIKGQNNITLTGFVPEKKISLYFSAADLVVLPYRTLMSSSGPLSLALSFAKPLLVSKVIAPLLRNGHAFSEKEILFDPEEVSLKEKLRWALSSDFPSKKMITVASELRTLRDYNLTGKIHFRSLFPKKSPRRKIILKPNFCPTWKLFPKNISSHEAAV